MMTRRNEHLEALLTKFKVTAGDGSGFRLIRSAFPGMPADDLLEIAPRRFTIKLLMSRSAAALPDNADAGTVLEVLQKKGAARRREIADKLKPGKTATLSRIRELVTQGLIEQVGKGPASRHRIKTHLT